jgi:hypothetical protein
MKSTLTFSAISTEKLGTKEQFQAVWYIFETH